MKKKLVFVLFALTPLLLFSQGFDHNRPSIGLNMGYNGYNGLIVGTEIAYPITKKLFVDARMKTPLENLFGKPEYNVFIGYAVNAFTSYSLGLGYRKKISDKFDFTFGLQYKYKTYKNDEKALYRDDEKSIILPFEIVYHINKRFAFKAGFTPSFILNRKHDRFKFCGDTHLSFVYKF